ncbi:MAG TPA: hypothetical protein DCZ95_03895 [Verrucomicrobia bacterium]|nr:hypothetical protein [Verrucomicrobiota bacterium]
MQTRQVVLCWAAAAAMWAGGALADSWMGQLAVSDQIVWPKGKAANYGTIKYFLNEAKNETIPIKVTVEVFADKTPATQLQVELFSNLNRRDFAKVYESPADAGKADSYYATYPMTFVETKSDGHHVYSASLKIQKCGAYRLTARFRINGGSWLWHNDSTADGSKQRDCAIVVSPSKARDLTIYEVNPLVVEAEPGGDFNHRSTFDDFTDHENDGFDPFNLNYVRTTLGFNTMWVMPIFPVTQWRWKPDSWDSNSSAELKVGMMQKGQWVENLSPGSPYSTRNYCAVDARHDAANTEASALSEFQYLVNKAEQIDLNVFIDVAFNHAGRDVALGQVAADLGYCQSGQINNPMNSLKWSWCTHGSSWAESFYRKAAVGEASCAHWAPADRKGEHIWMDANTDFFFGDYSSLGPKQGVWTDAKGWPENEDDLMYTDLSSLSAANVHEVWNYFANILPYWLDLTANKLDGIRADFAQGLPPQAWEYIINVTRQQKWDFIFLAEVLDPDQVQYRANRSFDILTTKEHGHYRDDHVQMSWIAGAQEFEANQLFGPNAVIMRNGTSHDESGNGNQWSMMARYAVCAASYGSPMVFMGQPLGVPHKINFESSWENIQPFWQDHNDANVNEMYRRINQARAGESALRSFHRTFLKKMNGGGYNESIFSVAAWSDPLKFWLFATPLRSIVLAFVNLDTDGSPSDLYAIPADLPLVDSTADVTMYYQAYNLVSATPDDPVWPAPRTAEDIRANGVGVVFSMPNEVQYLSLRIVDCVAEELGRGGADRSIRYLPKDYGQTLDHLRAIRQLASSSRTGELYAQQYYLYSGELLRILSAKGNEKLWDEAVYLIARMGRAAGTYVRDGDSWTTPPFSATDWTRGRAMLSQLNAQTKSAGLRVLLADLYNKSKEAEKKSFGALLRTIVN